MGNSSSSNSGSQYNRPPVAANAQNSHSGPQPYGYPPASVYNPQPYYNHYHNGQYYGGYPQQPAGQPYAYHAGYQHPTPPPSHPAAYNPANLVKTQEFQRTATIRNQVNLRKPTLKLEKVADSQVYNLSFKFDASSPGRVCTFIHATEDSKQGCKVTTPFPAPPAVNIPQGLDQSFPMQGNAEAQLHCLDLGLHNVKELLALGNNNNSSSSSSVDTAHSSTKGNTYAVVIRLEALTEEGRGSGKTLDGLKPGDPLPDWVQSQTTYAKLMQEHDGSLSLRIIKQKIWVKGEAYELQEIYGMERNRPANGSAAGIVMGTPSTTEGFEDVEGNECVICMSAPRDTAALPCRHMCMCHSCAGALKTQTNKCPICRNEIDKLLHIKINKGNSQEQGQSNAEQAR